MNDAHEWPALKRLDLNLFRVFEVVYRERNLTRAAALLHLSQSAVSHALARLREQLGDPLFVREGRGVAPTPLAEQLAPGILDALAGLQRSVTRVAAFDPLHDRRCFSLNMPEQMEPLLLPALCAHLQQHAPLVQVRSTACTGPSCAANWPWGESIWRWKSLALPMPNCASRCCCKTPCV